MRVYSPSRTKSFLECPAEWRLELRGWQPRAYGNKQLAGILGDAFHLAHAEFYRNGGHTTAPETLALDLPQIARFNVEQQLHQLEKQRFECDLKALDLRNALPLKAQTLVTRWLQQNPVPKEWQIVAVEHMLKDYGYCKIDLLVHPYPMDRLAVLDAKVKLRLEKKEFTKELEKFAYSWQFMHYAWAAEQHYEEPVQDYFVMMVVLEPSFQIVLEPYTINPELMQLWEQCARSAWAVMAAMDGEPGDLDALVWRGDDYGPYPQPLYPYHTWEWFTRYGRREYTDAFLRHRLHDHLMRQDYINTKEEEK